MDIVITNHSKVYKDISLRKSMLKYNLANYLLNLFLLLDNNVFMGDYTHLKIKINGA